jgi:hypothetical protein
MKSNSSQIGLNKGIKFLFLFLALCLGLFLPLKPAQALFGLGDIGILDLAMMQLDALDFGEGTILQLIFFLVLLLVESQVFLFLSAKLFQWAIDFPINLGITSENPLVTSGWQFTTGLVNTFLILIFVIIALAYILRIETFGAKKALPRLIIVAILINFSLVFIAIGVDTAQIILKSITSALGSNLARLAIDPLAKSLNNLFMGYIAILGAYTVTSLIPYANVAGIVALIVAFIAEAALGVISLTVLLIILGFGMGSIFFLYFIFFMIRVGMIWMLAILSPLAFAAAILPNTQKYWQQWLKLLLDWLFFGIIVLLLAGLGLKLFAENKVVPNTGPISVGPWQAFPAFSYNYIFLLIYLGIMIYYSKKKFAPELADVLISQGTGLAKRAAPMAGVARRGLTGWVSKQERLQKTAKKLAETPTPELRGWGRLKAPLVVPWSAVKRGVGRALGPRIIEEEKRRMSTIESETDKIKEPSLVASKTLDDIAARRLTEAVGRLSQAIEKGGPFKKSIVEKITPEQAVDLAKRAHDIGAVPEAERITRGFIHKFDPAEREDKLKEMGFKSYTDPDMTVEEQRDWDAKGYKTITEKLMGDARGNEVKDFAKGFWKAPEIMNAVQKFWGGPQLRRAAEEFGRAFVDSYMEEAERIEAAEPGWFIEHNQRAALYRTGNAAQDLGFRSPEKLTRDQIRELISWYRAAHP